MKIVICMKQIRHVYSRTGLDPAHQYLSEDDQIFRINPFDEAALELACRTKSSAQPEDVEIILLTIGGLTSEKELRRCLALGADHLYRIEIESDVADLTPDGKARLLARAATKLGADLVLCGKESLDRQNGQVGACLAFRLDLPFVSDARQLLLREDGQSLEIMRKAGKGMREIWSCSLPAVVSVDQVTGMARQPTLEAMYQAEQYPIRVLYDSKFVDPGKIEIRRRFAPQPRTKSISAPDSTEPAFERIQQLLIGSRVDKQSRMLEGDVAGQADEIIRFMQQNGYLQLDGIHK